MKLAIMQPYFFPYIGYFQLIGAVDLFIVYDNIKYTKKGWINRNRMLQNGRDAIFSLPLKGGADCLDVRDRELAPDFDRNKFLSRISGGYRRAPHFAQTFPLIERVLRNDERNLFKFISYSIVCTCRHLGIATPIKVSSDVNIDHGLKNKDRVLALCEAVGASTYVNPVGGTHLYSKEEFRSRGVELKFICSKPFEYRQFGSEFVASLSIVDVMMFNPPDTVREYIESNAELI